MTAPLQEQPNMPTEPAACPFLGILSDEETRYGFPSQANYCHFTNPAQKIDLGHQESTCLTSEYKQCPICHPEVKKLPDKTQSGITARPRWRRPLEFFIVAIFFIVIVIVFVISINDEGFFQSAEVGPPMPSNTILISPTTTPAVITEVSNPPTPTPTITIAPEQTATSTSQPEDIPTNTLASTANLIPSPTPGPALGTPFGDEHKYLVYKASIGESFPILAQRFETSSDVIKTINSLVPEYGLQVDQILIILPGAIDLAEVEPLVPVFLELDMTLLEIEAHYGIKADVARTYNDLGPEGIIPAGRWLIFPKQQVVVTPLPTPDLSHALTDPFGPENNYIIHRVQPGESLPILEELYLTSTAVIQRTNRIEGSIRVDQVLVIILNQIDPTGIQPLKAVLIEDELLVDDLAAQLDIQVHYLLGLNGLEPDALIPAGQWIVYPDISR